MGRKLVGDRVIVDENIDAAEAADHRVHQGGDVTALRDVGDEHLALRRLP